MYSLRIALTAGFPRGWGTYWRAFFLGRSLAERGHDVTLYCIAPEPRWTARASQHDGLGVVECPSVFSFLPVLRFGNSPLDIAFRYRELSRVPFDVVHGFEYSAAVSLPVWANLRWRKFTYVSDWCDWAKHGIIHTRSGRIPGAQRLVAWLEDHSRAFACGVTVISRLLEEHVMSLGFSQDRVLRLPGGAPTEEIQPIPKLIARQRLGFDPDMRCIAVLGVMDATALEPFARALATLKDEMLDLRLMLLGRHPERYVPICDATGLTNRLIVPGWIDTNDLPWYLACADLFINPLTSRVSEMARWPQKVGEYMASGRPILSSNIGDTAHFVLKHEAGLVTDNTVDDLRAKLLLLLSDEKLASRLGQNARRAAETQLSWSYLVERLEAFYFRLMFSQRQVKRITTDPGA